LSKQRERAITAKYRQDNFNRIHNKELEKKKKAVAGKYIKPNAHHQLPERK